jgi:hypothetical protein
VRKKCSHSILDVVVSDSTSTVAAEEDLVAECMDGLGDGKLLLSGEVSSAAAVVVRQAGKKGWSRKGTTGRRRRGSKAAGGRARMSWLKETGPRLTTRPDRAQNTPPEPRDLCGRQGRRTPNSCDNCTRARA